MTFYKEDEERPLICGQFTNWQPMRMMRIDEFAQSIDSETTRKGIDIFDILHKKGVSIPKSKDYKAMDHHD